MARERKVGISGGMTMDDIQEFPIRMVGIGSLVADHDIQSRHRMEPAHSRKIMKFILSNGYISEPIVVFDDGRTLRIADGFHRVDAYSQASRGDPRFEHVRAEIRPGTKRDALIFSAGANQTKTYLKRTKDDLKRAVSMLLDDEEWRLKSVGEIRKHIGLGSDATALRYILAYHAERKIPIPDFRVNTNGFRVGSRPKRSGAGEHKSYKIRSEPNGTPIIQRISRAGIPNRACIESDAPCFPGLFGRRGDAWVATWSGFESPQEAANAVGRLVGLWRHINANEPVSQDGRSFRAVVICDPKDGPQRVLDLYRAGGIEFMTIEDFVASLKGETEPHAPSEPETP